MFQIVNDDTKGGLVKSLSIATRSSMALYALYVSSAKYSLNKLLIPNRFFTTAVQFSKITQSPFLRVSLYFITYQQNASLVKLVY